MLKPTRLEFYRRGRDLITTLYGYTVPREGEYINIEKAQYKVVYVSWAIDTDPFQLRANIELEKVPNNEVGPTGAKK